MAVTVTIAGVSRTARVMYRSLKVSKVLNVETCSFDVYDPVKTTAAYRPQINDTVVINHDGGLLFGGTIVKVGDSRPGGDPNQGGALTRVTCDGYDKLLDKRRITKTFAAGLTTLAIAESIRSQFLSGYGITNTGATTGGPVMGELIFDMQTPRACLDALSAASGYVWRVSGAKAFAMFAAGASSGPVTLNDSNGEVVGPMNWERSATRKNNVIWMRTGSAPKMPDGSATPMPLTWQELWTGNGSKTVFYLAVRPDTAPTTVVVNGVPATIGAGAWTYDAVDNAIVRTTAVTLGHVISCDIAVTLPAWVREMDQSILVTNGSYNPALIAEDVISGEEIQAINQAINALSAELGIQTDWDRRKMTLMTRQQGFYPLLAATVSFANRDGSTISGSYLVHSVEITDPGIKQSTADELFYKMTLFEGVTWYPSWIDLWKRRQGGGSSGGTTIGTGGGSGGTGGSSGSGEYPVGHTIQVGGDNINAYPATTTFVDIPEMQGNKLGPFTGVWKFQAFGFQLSAGTLQVELYAGGVQIAVASTTAVGSLLGTLTTMTPVAVTMPGSVVDLLCRYRVTSGARDVVVGHCFLYRES